MPSQVIPTFFVEIFVNFILFLRYSYARLSHRLFLETTYEVL